MDSTGSTFSGAIKGIFGLLLLLAAGATAAVAIGIIAHAGWDLFMFGWNAGA